MTEPWVKVESTNNLPFHYGYYWVVLKDSDDVRLMEIRRETKFGYIFDECVIDGVCYDYVHRVGIEAWTTANVPVYERE